MAWLRQGGGLGSRAEAAPTEHFPTLAAGQGLPVVLGTY